MEVVFRVQTKPDKAGDLLLLYILLVSLLLVGGLGLVFLGGGPDLDELDGVDTEGLAEVGDDSEPCDGPLLVELGDLGEGHDDLVSGELELEVVGVAEVGLDDGGRLLVVLGDLLGDLHDVLEVVAGQGVVEVHLDTSGTDGHDGSGPVAEGDGESGVGVDLLSVEVLDGVGLDELGVPDSGTLLAGDLDGELLSDLCVGDRLVEGGEELLGSYDVGHGLVLDLLVVDAGVLRCGLVGGVVQFVHVCQVCLVVKADDFLSVVCHC